MTAQFKKTAFFAFVASIGLSSASLSATESQKVERLFNQLWQAGAISFDSVTGQIATSDALVSNLLANGFIDEAKGSNGDITSGGCY